MTHLTALRAIVGAGRSSSSQERRKAIWSYLCLLGALGFLVLRLRYSAVPTGSLLALNTGTEWLPFQYRDLVPLVVRIFAWTSGLQGGRDHVQIYFAIEFLAAVGSLLAGLLLLQRLKASSGWILVLYIMMLANYVFGAWPNYFWCYDIPAVLLMTLGLVLLLDRNWPWFYVLLPLAILNRETAASLIVVFSLVEWRRMPFWKYTLHITAQVSSALIVRLALWYVYKDNPGQSAWFYVFYVQAWLFAINWRFLHFPVALTAFGFMWVPFLFALPRLCDPFLRRAVWLVPLYLGGMFFVGNFAEFRIFSELLPLVMAVIAKGLGAGLLSAATPQNQAR